MINLFNLIQQGQNLKRFSDNTWLSEKIWKSEPVRQFSQNMRNTFEPIKSQVSESIKPLSNTLSSIGESLSPITKPIGKIATSLNNTIDYGRKVDAYYKPIRDEFAKSGITYENFLEIPEEDREKMFAMLDQVGIEVPWLAEVRAEQEQQRIQAEKQAEWDAKPWWDKGANIITNTVGGAVEEVPRVLGNTASFLGKVWEHTINRPINAAIAKAEWKTIDEVINEKTKVFEDIWGAGGDFIAKYGAHDTDSTEAQVGKLATQIGSAFVWPNKTGLITGAGKIGKIGRLAEEWAIIGAKSGIAQNAEVTPSDLMVGAGANVAGAGIIKWVGKIGSAITSKLPKTLIARGMTTPSALRNASERLAKLTDDGIVNIDDAPQWMLDKWLRGSKVKIQGQLGDVITKAKDAKLVLFASDTTNYASAPIVKQLKQALKEIKPLYMNGKVAKAGSESTLQQLNSYLTSKKTTIADIDKMRSFIGDMGIFRKTGEMSDSIAKDWLQKIWIDASKFIDNTLPWFRAINKDIEVAMALKKAIWLKEAQDAARQLMTLPSVGMSGIGWTIGYAQWGTPDAALKWAALWLWAKYLLNNPRFTTWFAQFLKKWSASPALKQWASKIPKVTIPILTNKKKDWQDKKK